MGNLTGAQSKGGFNVTGGGDPSMWNWGVSPFDKQAIDTALTGSEGTTKARYDQLGLGGSTMEQQDLGNAPSVTGGLPAEASAVLGQEQTANVGNAALNPALQTPISELIGAQSTANTTGTLASLAGQALVGAAAG